MLLYYIDVFIEISTVHRVSYSVPLKVRRQVIINQRGFSYHRGPPG